MQKTSNRYDEVIKALEKVFDVRYQYLREKEFGNHSYAMKILEHKYDPAVENLKKALDKLDNV